MLNMCEAVGCMCENVCGLTDDKFLQICQHLGKDAQVLEGLPGKGSLSAHKTNVLLIPLFVAAL